MEYFKNIRVVSMDIGWNNSGRIKALDEILEKDKNRNIIKKLIVRKLDSQNKIIMTESLVTELLGG